MDDCELLPILTITSYCCCIMRHAIISPGTPILISSSQWPWLLPSAQPSSAHTCTRSLVGEPPRVTESLFASLSDCRNPLIPRVPWYLASGLAWCLVSPTKKSREFS